MRCMKEQQGVLESAVQTTWEGAKIASPLIVEPTRVVVKIAPTAMVFWADQKKWPRPIRIGVGALAEEVGILHYGNRKA